MQSLNISDLTLTTPDTPMTCIKNTKGHWLKQLQEGINQGNNMGLLKLSAILLRKQNYYEKIKRSKEKIKSLKNNNNNHSIQKIKTHLKA